MSARGLKSQDSRKAIPSHYNASTVKCNRKGENPRRYQALEQSESSTSWLCKNSACRAFMSGDDSFCRRCSCCICHRYDDIKDTTLWLVCAESSDSCGSSCHIECAFRHQKVGVVDPGQYMGLDGNYCCPSCGKVTGILRFCKNQLEKAIFARWVDTLCYRLLLSYRLLDGTCKFKELLEVVKEAKGMLEAEVGPLDGGRDVIALGMVSRLPKRIRKLCFEAFEKCEEWLAVLSDTGGNSRVDSLPAACKFFFQEVTSSSLFLILVEIPILFNEQSIKGFKLWCWKSRTEMYPEDPICTLSRKQTRMLISDLEPCTEYSFRVVTCAENGELCQLEAKCFTRRKLLVREPISSAAEKRENPSAEGSSSDIKSDSAIDPSVLRNSRAGFEVQDNLGNMLHFAWDQEQRSSDAATVKCSTVCQPTGQASEDNQSWPAPRMLDLNVPDLNEDIMPAVEEDTAVGHDAAATSPGNHGNKIDGGDSLTCNCVAGGDARDVDSEAPNVRKRAVSAIRSHDCNSTLLHGSSVGFSSQSGSLPENFEHWVKIVFSLERKGYITSGFRQRFLTWYSLGCSEEERRVANTFFENLQHDHRSLAAQILDSFDEIIPRKRQNYG